MALIQWNIRGFQSNREQVRILFKEHDLTALCLQETKLGNISPNCGRNFLFYRSPPPPAGERAHGGTSIIVTKSVPQKIVQLNSILQACAIRIFINKWVTLCSLYLEPDLETRLMDGAGNPRQLEVEDLQSLLDQLPQPFILMGDFNAKHTLWGADRCDNRGQVIEELLDNNDIVLMNDGSPTRFDIVHNSTSAIDLTLCSSSLRLDYQWSVNENLFGSDHFPIHLKYVQNIPSPCLPKWKVKEADWQLYEKSTKVYHKPNEFSGPSSAYEYLAGIMIGGAMKSIPKTAGKPRRPLVPWWNNNCALSRKIARASYKRYRRRPVIINRVIYRRNLAKQKKVFKEARRECFILYISELKYNSPLSLVWDRVGKLLGKFSPSPLPVLKINLVVVSDAREVAEAFARHFSNISSPNHYSPEFRNIRNGTIVNPPVCSNSEAYNLPFSMLEFEYALSLSSPTSPGEDDILYAMISHLPQESKKFFVCVINEFWCSGTSYKLWKNSLIVPFLKPGKDPSLPKSYRPIALTSCVFKIYERMVNVRLVWLLESKSLLSERQFGFRKNRSTLDPLLCLSREIQNAFSVRNQTIAVFFDLEKAYDTTWRAGILLQLVEWRIGGNMFNFAKDFLSDRYLKVRIGSSFSSEYLQEEGIPQGSVLSPTFFNIAINGLLEQLPVGVTGQAFADDIVFMCSRSTAVEACSKIQSAINAATTWANNHGFKFSAEKTTAVRFCRTRRREEIPTLFLEDNILLYEDKVKYLGIIFDRKLTFTDHINNIVVNVKQRCNILKVVSNLNFGADRTTLLRIYQALCLSKIDYGSQVYGSACKTLLSKLDVVHNMALRICTGAFRTSPIDSLYVDSGFPPLFIRREEQGLRYMSRALTSQLNPNYKYIKNPVDRAPTKPKLPKPLEVRLSFSAREVGLIPPCVMEKKVSRFPPWCRPHVDICQISYSKKKNSSSALKSCFLDHVSQHSNSLSVYTDGSKSANGVGCSAIVGDHIIKKSLPNKYSIFNTEIFGILCCLKEIFSTSNTGDSFLIHCDSQSALAALYKLIPSNQLVKEVQDWLVLLHSRRQVDVKFCWVPAHVGIRGNERADTAAKQAASSPGSHTERVPREDFILPIRSYCRAKWQDHWSDLNSNFKLKSIRPSVQPYSPVVGIDRRSSIVLTRLRIGHTFLTHKYLLSSGAERQVPLCSNCNVALSVSHFLVDCPIHFNLRRRLGFSNKPLSEILGEDAPVDNLFKFLKEINLFYEI